MAELIKNSFGFKVLCQKRIELGNDVVSYCVLHEGHDGGCEPEKPPCSNCKALERWWREHNKKKG